MRTHAGGAGQSHPFNVKLDGFADQLPRFFEGFAGRDAAGSGGLRRFAPGLGAPMALNVYARIA